MFRQRSTYNQRMTPDLAELQHFVRHTLGCGCPDKVLEWIECSVTDAAPAHDIRLFRMDVGGRLLVYVIEGGDDSRRAAAVLPAILAAAMVERTTGGFNRLRLVVACPRPDESRNVLENSFNASAPDDDKVHLHVIAESELPFD
jgi:hypothetical protein